MWRCSAARYLRMVTLVCVEDCIKKLKTAPQRLTRIQCWYICIINVQCMYAFNIIIKYNENHRDPISLIKIQDVDLNPLGA